MGPLSQLAQRQFETLAGMAIVTSGLVALRRPPAWVVGIALVVGGVTWIAQVVSAGGARALGKPCVQMTWPSFSTDNRKLLATWYDLAADGDCGPSHLVLVDVASGEQTIISSTADGTTSFYMSTMSPDGSKVAATLETYTDATQNERTRSEVVHRELGLHRRFESTLDAGVNLTRTKARLAAVLLGEHQAEPSAVQAKLADVEETPRTAGAAPYRSIRRTGRTQPGICRRHRHRLA